MASTGARDREMRAELVVRIGGYVVKLVDGDQPVGVQAAIDHGSAGSDADDQELRYREEIEPISDPLEAELALRFTLSQPITAAIPPGEAALFRMAMQFAERFRPLEIVDQAPFDDLAGAGPVVGLDHRPRPRARRAGARLGRGGGRHPLPAPARAPLELQALAQVRQAHARHRDRRRRRGARGPAASSTGFRPTVRGPSRRR